MPDKKVQEEYPEKREFPRFVGIRCTKNSSAATVLEIK